MIHIVILLSLSLSSAASSIGTLVRNAAKDQREEQRREREAAIKPAWNDTKASTSSSSSAAAPPPLCTVVVLVDRGTQRYLQAAQCSYLRALDPRRVIYVKEGAQMPASAFPSPPCAPVVHSVSLQAASSSNLHVVFERLVPGFRGLLLETKWALVVRPWTLVNPAKLAAYIGHLNARDRGRPPLPWTRPLTPTTNTNTNAHHPATASGARSNSSSWSEGTQPEVFIGRVSDAAADLALLGSPPHVLLEFGLLLRSEALLQVS